MTNEIVKHEKVNAIESLRSLVAEHGYDALSISKTAVKDGTKGLVSRGLTVLQRWNEVRFWDAFMQELDEMREAGEIRDDLNRTDAGVASLREFFELIDGKPDEARFHAFCALFMCANAPDADSSEAILDLELMGILRKLSAGEMHLLSAFLKVRKYSVGTGPLVPILKELGYNSEAFVDKNVTALIEHHLIDRGGWTQRGGSSGEEKGLLTDLGALLVQRIEKYNDFKASHTSSSATTRL
jgi:hypothetical protein